MDKDTATRFFAEFFRGTHRVPKLTEYGTGWSINHRGDLATWDFNSLTRLVVMAHEEHIRVEITPVRYDMVRIAIHPRPEGWKMHEHPPLDRHISKIKDERRVWYLDHAPVWPSEIESSAGPDGDSEKVDVNL